MWIELTTHANARAKPVCFVSHNTRYAFIRIILSFSIGHLCTVSIRTWLIMALPNFLYLVTLNNVCLPNFFIFFLFYQIVSTACSLALLDSKIREEGRRSRSQNVVIKKIRCINVSFFIYRD